MFNKLAIATAAAVLLCAAPPLSTPADAQTYVTIPVNPGITPSPNLGGPQHVGNMCWNESFDVYTQRGFGYWKPCS